jgi:hypothetical protein
MSHGVLSDIHMDDFAATMQHSSEPKISEVFRCLLRPGCEGFESKATTLVMGDIAFWMFLKLCRTNGLQTRSKSSHSVSRSIPVYVAVWFFPHTQSGLSPNPNSIFVGVPTTKVGLSQW